MTVPGSNLLAQALRLIGQQRLGYLAYVSRAVNDIGYLITDYAPEIEVLGSFQPIPRRLYAVQGLEFNKNYANIFVPQNIVPVDRDAAGDRFMFQGQGFQVLSTTPWFDVDGWTECLCVRVP